MSELRFHSEVATAGILYYSFYKVGEEAVYQLVDLKYNFALAKDPSWQPFIQAVPDLLFGEGHPPWDTGLVAQEIARLVDSDKFMAIAEIDEECEKVLRKACCDTRHCSIFLC